MVLLLATGSWNSGREDDASMCRVKLFLWFILRHLRRERLRTILTVAGIAVGIAVVAHDVEVALVVGYVVGARW